MLKIIFPGDKIIVKITTTPEIIYKNAIQMLKLPKKGAKPQQFRIVRCKLNTFKHIFLPKLKHFTQSLVAWSYIFAPLLRSL